MKNIPKGSEAMTREQNSQALEQLGISEYNADGSKRPISDVFVDLVIKSNELYGQEGI